MDLAAEARCDYKHGQLSECAPLAVSYTPIQQENPPKYAKEEALTRGTLFPGLDLPFKNQPNSTNPYAGTPLGELMAIDFMVKELSLYLDTHPDDQEAFETLKTVIDLANEGEKEYTKLYGPVTLSGVRYSKSYDWIHNPWPWENAERGAK
jgi:spore coat protein JB